MFQNSRKTKYPNQVTSMNIECLSNISQNLMYFSFAFLTGCLIRLLYNYWLAQLDASVEGDGSKDKILNIIVPKDADDAMSDMLNCVLESILNSWYKSLSDDRSLQIEIKLWLKHFIYKIADHLRRNQIELIRKLLTCLLSFLQSNRAQLHDTEVDESVQLSDDILEAADRLFREMSPPIYIRNELCRTSAQQTIHALLSRLINDTISNPNILNYRFVKAIQIWLDEADNPVYCTVQMKQANDVALLEKFVKSEMCCSQTISDTGHRLRLAERFANANRMKNLWMLFTHYVEREPYGVILINLYLLLNDLLSMKYDVTDAPNAFAEESLGPVVYSTIAIIERIENKKIFEPNFTDDDLRTLRLKLTEYVNRMGHSLFGAENDLRKLLSAVVHNLTFIYEAKFMRSALLYRFYIGARLTPSGIEDRSDNEELDVVDSEHEISDDGVVDMSSWVIRIGSIEECLDAFKRVFIAVVIESTEINSPDSPRHKPRIYYVKRRYNDFYALQMHLLSIIAFSESIDESQSLPALPPRQAMGVRSVEVMRGKCPAFERFLNAAVKITIVSTNCTLHSFLTIDIDFRQIMGSRRTAPDVPCMAIEKQSRNARSSVVFKTKYKLAKKAYYNSIDLSTKSQLMDREIRGDVPDEIISIQSLERHRTMKKLLSAIYEESIDSIDSTSLDQNRMVPQWFSDRKQVNTQRNQSSDTPNCKEEIVLTPIELIDAYCSLVITNYLELCAPITACVRFSLSLALSFNRLPLIGCFIREQWRKLLYAGLKTFCEAMKMNFVIPKEDKTVAVISYDEAVHWIKQAFSTYFRKSTYSRPIVNRSTLACTKLMQSWQNQAINKQFIVKLLTIIADDFVDKESRK